MLKEIPIDKVQGNSDQPRQHFEVEEIQNLADSIRTVGQISPITVRPKDGAYQIVEGERRWRAAKLLGQHSILAVVRELDDESAFLVALTANVQRADLDSIDEAKALQRLIDQYGYSQAKVGESLGKSQQYVAGKLALLRLCPEVEALVTTRAVSASAGRIIATVHNPASQMVLAKAVMRGLSVKRLQSFVAEAKEFRAENDPFGMEISIWLEEYIERWTNLESKIGGFDNLSPQNAADLLGAIESTQPIFDRIHELVDAALEGS